MGMYRCEPPKNPCQKAAQGLERKAEAEIADLGKTSCRSNDARGRFKCETMNEKNKNQKHNIQR